jgi:hypothetical protein
VNVTSILSSSYGHMIWLFRCVSLFFHSTTSAELHFGIGQKENGLVFMFELVLIAILIAQVQGITNEIIILVCSIHWDVSTLYTYIHRTVVNK